MYKKIFVSLTFLMLFFSIFIALFSGVSADTKIVDIEYPVYDSYHNHIVRLSNGTVCNFYAYGEGSNDRKAIGFTWSEDNGSTWASPIEIYNPGGNDWKTYSLSVGVDSLDLIHIIFYQEYAYSGYTHVVYMKQSSTNFTDFTGTTIGSDSSSAPDFYGCDLAVDKDDNIHVFYGYSTTGLREIRYKKYLESLHTWGSEKSYSVPSVPSGIYNIEVDLNNVPYMFYSLGSNIYATWFSNNAWLTPVLFVDMASAIGSFATAFYDGDIYDRIVVVWTNPDDGLIQYKEHTIGIPYIVASEYTYLTVYNDSEGNIQYDVSLSIRYDGTVDIFWRGATEYSVSHQIMHRSRNIDSNEWIDEFAFLTTGSDSHVSPTNLYQYNNEYCVPFTDYFLVYYNSTDDELIYYDDISPVWMDDYVEGDEVLGPCDFSDNKIFYTGSDTLALHDLDDNKYMEYVSLDSNVYTWNIKGLKLLVDDKQIDSGSLASDYNLFINGNFCGIATNLYSVYEGSQLRYIIEWCGLDISITAEHLVLEWSNSNPSPTGDYWEPIARFVNDAYGVGYYHNSINKFGNGNVDGSFILFYATMWSPVFWIYYDTPAGAGNNVEPFPDDINTSNHDKWDDFYVEFEYDDKCYYGIGSEFRMMVNTSDTYFGDTDGYLLILKYLSGSSWINVSYYDLTMAEEDISGYVPWDNGYTFQKIGQYKISIYNKTADGKTKEFIGDSDPVTVCKVGFGQVDPIIDPPIDPLFDFSDLPVLYKVIISLFIIICLTISPYFFAAMINQGRTSVEMPDLVYVAFFFIGVIVSIMLGFLEIWVFFVILVGLIITFAIFWLQGKDIGGGE